MEVQACCWWCLGAEEYRGELRSFSRCTGTLTIALQNHIKGKLYFWLSVRVFRSWDFLLVKYFLGAQIALLYCSSELSHASPSTIWQTPQKSSKIRYVMPDSDLPNLICMKTMSILLLLWQSKAESNLKFMNTRIQLLYLSLMARYQ